MADLVDAAAQCPFCGAHDAELCCSGALETPPFWIECRKCGASGPASDYQTGALEDWNDRP